LLNANHSWEEVYMMLLIPADSGNLAKFTILTLLAQLD